MGNTAGWPLGPLWLSWGLGPWGITDPIATAGIIPPSASDMIECYNYFGQSDGAESFNRTRQRVLPKGIYWAGLHQLVPGQLKVKISAYAAVAFNGLVVRDLSESTVTLTAGLVQRVVLYATGGELGVPTTSLFAIAETTFQGHARKEEMITFLRVDVPPGSTEILDGMINITVRDTIDGIARSPWRGAVASESLLPMPPSRDVRRGDQVVILDTLEKVEFDGSAWQRVEPGGILNLGDARHAEPGSAEAPRRETGRVADTAPLSAVRRSRSLPVFHALSRIAPDDADVGSVIANRDLKVSASEVLYAKSRNAANPAEVEAGDIRLGAVPGLSGFFAAVVETGDPDEGDALSAGSLVIGADSGQDTYWYLQLTPGAVVAVGDRRLWQADAHPARLGLRAAGVAVGAADLDVGDSVVDGYVYSRGAPADEDWYASKNAGLVAVTDGDLRLSTVVNTAYDAAQVAIEERSDGGGGAVKYRQPNLGGGDENSVATESAGTAGGKPRVHIVQDGVGSGDLDQPALALLVGGETKTPVDAGSLHTHMAGARGDGLRLGCAPSLPGGLFADVASGLVYHGGIEHVVDSDTLAIPGTDGTYYVSFDFLGEGGLFVTNDPEDGLFAGVPIARVVVAGGAITSLTDLRRFIQTLDEKVRLTVGNSIERSHFTSLQAAVDWWVAQQEVEGLTGRAPRGCEFIINDDVDMTGGSSVLLDGLEGVTIRGIPHAKQSGAAGAWGPQIRWNFDGPAIDLGGAQDVTFDGVHFKFEGVNFGDLQPACFGNAISSTPIGENVVLKNCTTQVQSGQSPMNNLRFFLFVVDDVVNVRVEDCIADVTDSGIYVTGTATQCRFTGNAFRPTKTSSSGNDASDYGIYVTNLVDSVIEGNHLHPAAGEVGDGDGFIFGVAVNTAATRSVIERNVARFSGTTGGVAGIYVGGGSRFSIRDNIILSDQTASYVGIDAPAGSFSKVDRNTLNLANLEGHGIRVVLSDSQVVENIISMSAAAGADQVAISLSGARGICSKNSITNVGAAGATNYALTLEAGSSRWIVTGNSMGLNVFRGIANLSTLAGGGKNVIAGCFVETEDECVLLSGTGGATLAECMLKNAGATVVNVGGTTADNLIILGNIIEGGGVGISVAEASYFTIAKNRILTSGNSIDVGAASDGGTIEGNNCQDSGDIVIAGGPGDTTGLCLGNYGAGITDGPGWTPTSFTNGANGLNKF